MNITYSFNANFSCKQYIFSFPFIVKAHIVLPSNFFEKHSKNTQYIYRILFGTKKCRNLKKEFYDGTLFELLYS